MKIELSRSVGCALLALFALLPVASRAADAAMTRASEPKGEPAAYTLFTGADINVLHQGTLYRVRGVEGSAFIIHVEGAKVAIPLGRDPQDIKVAVSQQLSDRQVTVSNYKYERVYTPGHDPYQKFLAEMRGRQTNKEVADTAATIRDQVPVLVEGKDLMGRPDGSLQHNEVHDRAADAADRASVSTGSNMGDDSFYLQRLEEERKQELFDALEISFGVSTNKPLTNPYLVIVATYHEKDDAKYKRNWLLTKPLDPIETTPKDVILREPGFPPGFIIDSLKVHLYQNGREVATSLSEHQAALTRDEAHEYLIIEYVSANKNATKEPHLALAKLPDDWPSRRQEDSARKVYYVKVDPAGRAESAFEDETCETKVTDSYYENILKGVLFLPALKSGKAVEGVAQVKLAEMPL
jgi:hypothetical protein